MQSFSVNLFLIPPLTKNIILKCFLLKLKNVEEKEGEQEGHCASEIKM